MFTTFLSNISYAITKECLYDLLIQITPIKSLDYKRKVGFVIYFTREDQMKSYNILNLVQLYDRRIVMNIVEEKTIIKIGCSIEVDVHYLKDIFSKFGSCEIIRKNNQYFSIFRKKEEAEQAQKVMDRKRVFGKIFTAILCNDTCIDNCI